MTTASRWWHVLGSAGLALLFSCTGNGAGCGCAMDPLPAGGLPADQTIEGGAQVRLTKAGFGKVEAVIRAVIADQFADGMCVGALGTSIIGIDVDVCYRNQCAGGAAGCRVNVDLNSVNFSAVGGDTLRIQVGFTIPSVPVPAKADLGIFGEPSCTAAVAVRNGAVDADVRFTIDSVTGELGVQLVGLRRLDISGLNLDASDCGIIIDAIASFAEVVADLLSTRIGNLIVNLVVPLLGDVVNGFLPDPLGIEGMLDVGALLGSVSPGTSASLETRMVPGGYVSLPGEGLSLGMIAGLNSDRDVSTRSPDLDNEPARCVPAIDAPNFAAAPHSLPTTSRNTFTLPPAAEFLGQPDPANDLVFGVSETFLDLAGHHVVASGAMCLGVGNELIPQLNLGFFGILVPSLAELGSEAGDDPLMLVLRPGSALDFSIGDGTEQSPSLTIHISDLQVDVYAFLFERFVRGFTLGLTMDLGLNLEYTLDADGNPALEPVLVGLDSNSIGLSIHNTEILREDPAVLEELLPLLLELALPLIGEGFGPIALPDFAGFTLSDLRIAKVTTDSDQFLALYANLAAAQAMAARLGDRVVPGGALAQLLEAGQASLPVADPVDTRATLVRTVTPAPEKVRAWLAHAPGGQVPEVVIDVAADDARGRAIGRAIDRAIDRPIEWTWRIDGGFWHPYQSGAQLVLRDRSLSLPGRRLVEIKARAVGDFRSVDPTPAQVPVVIDSSGPRIHGRSIRVDGGAVRVEANDLVMSDAPIEFAFAGGADAKLPDTAWSTEGTIPAAELDALAIDGWATVFARDALGNWSVLPIDVTAIIGYHGRPEGDTGCACAVGDASASHSGGFAAALGLGLLALIGLRRRGRGVSPAPSRRMRWPRWSTLAVLLFGLVAPGCSCGSENAGDDEPMPPECEENLECQAGCASDEVGICIDNECRCAPDVPLGNIGQYSQMAMSPDGAIWVSAYNQRHGDLMVARWDEGGRVPDDAWEFVDGVPDGPVVVPESRVRGGIMDAGDDVGLYTSIASTADDVAMVSYFDRTNATLRFASNAGGTWVSHDVDRGAIGDPELGYQVFGQYSSLTVRADDGRPGIAYFAQIADDGANTLRTELRFAQAQVAAPASEADWRIEVVDSVTVVTPEEGQDPQLIPEGVGLFVSAARAADGTPIMVYYDRVHGDLKLARVDAAAGGFVTETLDGDGGVDVGWYPSIGVDADGVAHVSYLSATTDDLLYINTRDRVIELIDDGYRIDGTTDDGLPRPVFHLVGDDSALILTGVVPVVAYQDATTHELLLAQRTATGEWVYETVAGDELPFAGAYGFYASAAWDGGDAVMSNWVINQPESDAWVEILRRSVVVE